MRMICPMCEEALEIPENELGQTVPCPVRDKHVIPANPEDMPMEVRAKPIDVVVTDVRIPLGSSDSAGASATDVPRKGRAQ